MERLWSPWRSTYIQSFASSDGDDRCVFCEALEDTDDDQRFLVKRHDQCYAILNLYPYNSGHLLIVSNRHVPTLHELDDTIYSEMMLMIRRWSHVIQQAMHPHGFNIGLNIGRTAGAGIDMHIHWHIVPRWRGDVNFMPVIGDTKVISEDMRETMIKFRETYEKLYS
ncbi:MAG: HIT domain-containing protein [Chlorobi bacterium]|nr:HIT domain-containing protein [Chlorobiota bacterium]